MKIVLRFCRWKFESRSILAPCKSTLPTAMAAAIEPAMRDAKEQRGTDIVDYSRDDTMTSYRASPCHKFIDGHGFFHIATRHNCTRVVIAKAKLPFGCCGQGRTMGLQTRVPFGGDDGCSSIAREELTPSFCTNTRRRQCRQT
jgi:hypothetical protein